MQSQGSSLGFILWAVGEIALKCCYMETDLEGSMRKVRKPTGQLQAEAELVRAGDEKGTNSKAIQDFRNHRNFMHMEVFAVCLRNVLGVGVCISVYLYAGQWSW